MTNSNTTSDFIAYSPAIQSSQTALAVPGGGDTTTTTTTTTITSGSASITTSSMDAGTLMPMTEGPQREVSAPTGVTLPQPQPQPEGGSVVQDTSGIIASVAAQQQAGASSNTPLTEAETTRPGPAVAVPSPAVLYIAASSGAGAAANNFNADGAGTPLTAGSAPVVVGGTNYSLTPSGGALYANSVGITFMPTMPSSSRTTGGQEGVAVAVMSAFGTSTAAAAAAAAMASGQTDSKTRSTRSIKPSTTADMSDAAVSDTSPTRSSSRPRPGPDLPQRHRLQFRPPRTVQYRRCLASGLPF
ncbi:hypothetical protein B0A55_12073 [Friedmanniomyces simplex]|uniref:Uncharacterized protein n=1 Tax=Friedmanniomyces simplex TaxID=329884 RepID=A0A4U0WN08_9PEZI|nr:hypothetical protein B0A55_12073 [Friedmanniomyces simplex]